MNRRCNFFADQKAAFSIRRAFSAQFDDIGVDFWSSPLFMLTSFIYGQLKQGLLFYWYHNYFTPRRSQEHRGVK